MAKLTNLILEFDDKTFETDFYNSVANQNQQDLVSSLGLSNSIEDLVSITDDDRKAYTLALFRRQLTDAYVAEKRRQAFAVVEHQFNNAPKPLETDPVGKKPKK